MTAESRSAESLSKRAVAAAVRLGAYAFGQAIGYATDLAIFFALMSLARLDTPILAHLCSKFGSAALTYFYHARFSFPGAKANSQTASTLAYVAMVVFNMVFTAILLKALILLFPAMVYAAKIAADVAGVLMTYVLMRTLVFPRAAA